MKIETTKSYSLFLENDEQRPINEHHVAKLAASMRTHGFLPSKPIQCYKSGANLVVVDGHHRLSAAKKIGIPVLYVVEASASQNSMADENRLVLKWEALDFVRMHAIRGNPIYMEIMEYADKGIPVRMAASMLAGQMAASGNVTGKLTDGTFKIKDRSHIQAVLSILEAFGSINPAVKSVKFIGALSRCLFVPEFDIAVFRARMASNTRMIKAAPTWQTMVDQIEALYNYRSKSAIPLGHLVHRAMRERNAI